MMLLDGSFDILKRGLSYSVYRHDLIADNIANVSTTGYRRKDVEFRGVLEENMNNSLPAYTTNIKHMPLNTEALDRPFVVTNPSETDVKSDNNNVDLDKEITNMANNQTYYNALATILTKKLRIIKEAVAERVI